MRLNRNLCSVLVGMNLVGCATIFPPTEGQTFATAGSPGVIGYVETLRLASMGGGAPHWVFEDAASYKGQGWWCPHTSAKHPEVGPAYVQAKLTSYCAERGGVMIVAGGACIAKSDPETVLFLAQVLPAGTTYVTSVRTGQLGRGSGWTCNAPSAHGVETYLIQPKPGLENSPRYRQSIADSGAYAYPSVERNKQGVAEMQSLRERYRMSREMPLLTTRGTRVCHDKGSFTYVGFVGDANAGKIEVRVIGYGYPADMRSGDSRMVAQPRDSMWYWPTAWYVCQ